MVRIHSNMSNTTKRTTRIDYETVQLILMEEIGFYECLMRLIRYWIFQSIKGLYFYFIFYRLLKQVKFRDRNFDIN